jgi:hypothetical protein
MPPAPSTYAANLQWGGFALETVYGTPIATPSVTLPMDAPVYKHIPQLLVDSALRGSMGAEYNQLNGLFYDSFQTKTNLYEDSVYPLFRQALGLPDVLSGSADPWTHKTSLQNANGGQPAGTTLFWSDAAGKVLQIPGCIAQSLKVDLKDAALANLDMTWLGMPANAITPPTLTQPSLMPAPSWNLTATLGGVGAAFYSEVSLEIKRATEMIPTLNGTQSPAGIFGGPVSVAGTLTSLYQGYAGDTHVQNQLADAIGTLSLKIAPVGDAIHSLTMQMSRVKFDDVAVSGTNKWMEVKTTFKALSNPTDVAGGGNLSPMLVTLLSSISTAL